MAVMIQFKPDTSATGSITTVATASLVDGETFTLDDGVTAVTFEFDKTPDGVTPGNVAIDISALTTADEVRDAIIGAIQGTGGFGITAADGGAATVSLTHIAGGTIGNTTSADTVANAGFIVTNMAGGLDDGAFSTVLAAFATNKHKARWVLQSGVESSPHIAHKTWFGGPQGSYAQPPSRISSVVKYGGPSWFETADELNKLPYSEIRAQLANEVERGILQVLDSGGTPVTATAIRGGTVT